MLTIRKSTRDEFVERFLGFDIETQEWMLEVLELFHRHERRRNGIPESTDLADDGPVPEFSAEIPPESNETRLERKIAEQAVEPAPVKMDEQPVAVGGSKYSFGRRR